MRDGVSHHRVLIRIVTAAAIVAAVSAGDAAPVKAQSSLSARPAARTGSEVKQTDTTMRWARVTVDPIPPELASPVTDDQTQTPQALAFSGNDTGGHGNSDAAITPPTWRIILQYPALALVACLIAWRIGLSHKRAVSRSSVGRKPLPSNGSQKHPVARATVPVAATQTRAPMQIRRLHFSAPEHDDDESASVVDDPRAGMGVLCSETHSKTEHVLAVATSQDKEVPQ